MNRPVSVKACRCPGCGRRTEYDPARVARYARRDARQRWRGYDYVVCAHCGSAVLVPDGGGEPEALGPEGQGA